jgi:hypothetical protein
MVSTSYAAAPVPRGLSADAEVVDALEGSAADPADHRVTIAANQRIGSRACASGAVQFGGMLGFGHTAIIVAYWAAFIESTLMVLLLASSVPITMTFLPANCSGVFWSLRV